jgi:hypothetical protein
VPALKFREGRWHGYWQVSAEALHQGYMKNTCNTNTRKTSSTKTAPKAKLIKLGIDVHADSFRVVRQIDNDTPQPAQKFTPEGFLVWVAKQIALAQEVHSCYEAGPFLAKPFGLRFFWTAALSRLAHRSIRICALVAPRISPKFLSAAMSIVF